MSARTELPFAGLLLATLLLPASAVSEAPSDDDRRPFLLGGIQLNEDDHERWAAALIQAGMNAVEVTAYAHQGAWNTADLWYAEEEPAVHAEIRAARRNGLQVVLVLRVALDHNDPANRFLWHGLIFPRTEEELAAWFEKYGDYVVRWARVAQAEGVEVLGLASELNSLLATLPVEEIPELPAYYLSDAKQQELRELVGRYRHLFGEEDRIAMGAGDFASLDELLVARNRFERRWARAYTFTASGAGAEPAEDRIDAINRRRRVLEDHWRRLIERVRAVYGGRLTLAANFDNYQDVSFWDGLDFLGINAYFPLREALEAPLNEAGLTESWRGVFAGIEAFRRKRELSQEVIFTELGYTRRRGVTVAPWSSSGFVPMWDEAEDSVLLWSAQPIAPRERALAVGALHAAWRRYDLPLAGVLYWKLSSRAELGRYEPFMLYLGADSQDPLYEAFTRFADQVRPLDAAGGRLPLHSTVRLGRGDEVRRRVGRGVDLAARDGNGYLPLHWSCYQRDPSLVALLLPPEPVSWLDDLGETPLHKCARLDNVPVARELLRHRGEPLVAARGDDSPVPLHLAAELASAGMVELLLAHGAGAGEVGVRGVTPFHAAARRGDPAIVERLAKAAGAGAPDIDGNLPVSYAAYFGKPEVFQLLWRPEASRWINAAGQSFLHLAAHGGDLTIVETLLRHGLAVGRADSSGRTPLHYAVMKTHRPVVRRLLEHGAAVDRSDGEGQAALHLAAEKDDALLLQLVLARAPAPDIAGAGGDTPLHRAAGWGRLENVRLLLAAGARPGIRNHRGQTALQFAEAAGRKRVAELLRDLDPGAAPSAGSKIR